MKMLDVSYPEPRATFDDYMAHMLHALKLVGPEHVGVGADWDGGGGVVGMEDCASNWKITARLLKEGYREDDLQKIWSGNALRVLKAARDARLSLQSFNRRVGPLPAGRLPAHTISIWSWSADRLSSVPSCGKAPKKLRQGSRIDRGKASSGIGRAVN